MDRLLVVDDEVLILSGMSGALRKQGLFEVLTARSGVEALSLIQSHEIDAMLLDIAMPDMNGMELMRALKARDKKPLTVIISGFEEFAYARQALEYGACDYLLKPLDADDIRALGEKLHALLEKRRDQSAPPVQTMVRPAEPNAPGPEQSRAARLVREAIEREYADSALSVTRLSRALNYSSNHLGNAFKREYGISVNDYINQLRMKRAAKLLQETDLMIFEVASRVGYGDQRYFSRVFKRTHRCSPSEYRARR